MARGNEYIQERADKALEITSQGREYLARITTDVSSPIYFFTDEAKPMIVAASMARLSRRMGDLRETYLEEFAGREHRADELIKRVVTEYGDDSVQQLFTMQFVVEGASNILTKKLEWGRLASYLEQSTRYIYYDQKDLAGNYRYYVPFPRDTPVGERYVCDMERIFSVYSDIVRVLTSYVRMRNPAPKAKEERTAWTNATRAQACDAARLVLPAATRSTVGIAASAQAVESLVIHLLSEPLEEARRAGEAILREARKVAPAFLERADLPDRGSATTLYCSRTRSELERLVSQVYRVAPSVHGRSQGVSLQDYWPRREAELVPDMAFAVSHLSMTDLRSQLISAEDERRVFDAYIGERLNRRHRPARALERAHFEWEVVCDYGIFRDLQRHRMIDALEWQNLTTRYGYSVPELIIESGLEPPYRRCFEIAQELHEYLVSEGYAHEAQYATLLGHWMRWRFVMNLRAHFHFLELRTQPAGHPGYRKLCMKMHELLSEVYPWSGAAMRFVNKGEDPELTRLAAERVTQAKLSSFESGK